MKEECEKILSDLTLLKKKVIVESEGDDVLTIQLMGQMEQIFRDMFRELIKIEEQYSK